jgi:hypothetical protein
LFSNLIIQALPKIPKLIYLNGFAALIKYIFSWNFQKFYIHVWNVQFQLPS